MRAKRTELEVTRLQDITRNYWRLLETY